MRDKNYLVTGATGGIGRRVCLKLAEHQTKLILAARPTARLESVVSDLRGLKGVSECVPIPLDFENTRTVELANRQVAELGMSIDGLVLVYPSIPKSPEIIPAAAEWQEALNRCFVNPLFLLRGCLDSMADGSRIVIVSGIASVQVFPDLAYSNAIRAAWLAEAKLLAFRLGQRQIRVNTLSLGGTLTERFTERLASAGNPASEDHPDRIALGHYGNPEDVADVVVSLLGNLSNHITGANIVCDGGLTKSY
jgi:3-oxoacyl-[acyl-carrier protein] reductase